ncbi:MAG TPA: YigZ family protein [Bacteroidales bacterium]|nr:YigZ family protein [Bacteroidales bacterium]HSA42734.1 YigZ family protein [Bacteroidales bacterium]
MSEQTDTYYTVAGSSMATYRDKASRFIGLVEPVLTEEAVKTILKSLKKTYYDANHHCYAYRLGWDYSLYRMNDDGEPSGTAGRPIFGQIQSFNLTNVLVVVVRYFGGTKLGASGLINAYRTVTRDALQQAGQSEKTVHEHHRLDFAYDRMNEVMKIIKEKNLQILSTDFMEKCSLVYGIRRQLAAAMVEEWQKKPGISVQILKTE